LSGHRLRQPSSRRASRSCTIHQPSSLLFENFDRLLLLERGGKTVYFGPVGKDSQELVKYFEEQGAPMEKTANPAEAMLDIIGAGSQKRVGPRDWADVYLDSTLYQENLKEIEAIKEHALANPRDEGKVLEYATPYMYQLKQVFWRTAVSSWRQPDYQFTRLFQHAAIALITGLLFLQLGNSVQTLQYRVFSLFMVAVLPALILAQIEPFYIMARGTFMREDSSKMYRGTVFASAQILAEVPYSIACALVYFLLFYFTAGFQTGSDRAGYFFAMLLLVEFFATSLGQLVAAVNPSIYLASVWNPFIIIIFFWRQWRVLIWSLFCPLLTPYPATGCTGSTPSRTSSRASSPTSSRAWTSAARPPSSSRSSRRASKPARSGPASSSPARRATSPTQMPPALDVCTANTVSRRKGRARGRGRERENCCAVKVLCI
jgi:hypothetical protein